MSVQLHHGDCLDVLRAMPENSVDSIVTDPPYGLSFMGRRWDYDVPGVEVWAECLRVLKPGGHLLAFAGTRTQHRMAVRIEDAGFEIRDMIAWVYGSGFPKSLDVSKAIDKTGGASVAWFGPWFRKWREERGITQKQVAELFPSKTGGLTGCVANWELGMNMPTPEQFNLIRDTFGLPFESIESAQREVIGQRTTGIGTGGGSTPIMGDGSRDITAPTTEAARQWQGWGTALKPALETVTFASKPFTDEQERDIIMSNLIRLEARLWLLSSVSAAEKSSTSSRSEFDAACVIAQWSADEITSTRAALCDPMGMSLFELATTTSLNIVSSWRRTLAESWSDGSTSTTETKSSTTTDWRTLKFSLSQITPSTIIRACSLPGGFSVNASTAESHFNASLSLLQSIRTLSATERAMSQAQHEHQDAGVKPNLDPCIMARKPLVGTVAANVLEWGTWALNIDGCRVAGEPWKAHSATGLGSVKFFSEGDTPVIDKVPHDAGRWPANLIHDGSSDVVAAFPDSNGSGPARKLNRSAKPEQQGWGMNTTASDVASLRDAGTGSAARFFMQCKGDYNDAWQDLNLPQENANTAEQSSSQQRQAAVSALVLAVSSALPEGLLCSGLSMAPFTSATANELRLIAETATQTIQTIGSKFWRESKPARLSLSLNHASDAEIQRLTDTTTITVSRWKSDGSAEPVTFSITPMSLEVGGKDCAPSMDGKRFMYCAKASKADREEGLDGAPDRVLAMSNQAKAELARGNMHEGESGMNTAKVRKNHHPTVKPTDLMAYLVRLVTPPGGVVLDPFMGSGSTGKAAMREGMRFIGIERDAGYFEIARHRVVIPAQRGLEFA